MGSNTNDLNALAIQFNLLVAKVVHDAITAGKELRSYEGAISMHCPPLVRCRSRSDGYTVRLSCSVLGEPSELGGHYAWHGKSWGEVFEKATADVAEWAMYTKKPAKKRARKKKPEAMPAAPQVPMAKVYNLSARRNQAQVQP